MSDGGPRGEHGAVIEGGQGGQGGQGMWIDGNGQSTDGSINRGREIGNTTYP